jgi:hypothetical protein
MSSCCVSSRYAAASQTGPRSAHCASCLLRVARARLHTAAARGFALAARLCSRTAHGLPLRGKGGRVCVCVCGGGGLSIPNLLHAVTCLGSGESFPMCAAHARARAHTHTHTRLQSKRAPARADAVLSRRRRRRRPGGSRARRQNRPRRRCVIAALALPRCRGM